MSHYIELAIYRVKESALAAYLPERERIGTLLGQHFPGFVRYDSTQDVADPRLFMDHVTWENLDLAKRAAEKIQATPEFSSLFEAIEEVAYFGHFKPYQVTVSAEA